MAHLNLTQANLPSQKVAFPPTPTPSPSPIKEGGSSIACHTEWKEKFLGGGEYISIPLRRQGGGMLKIPRIEIVRCMEKLYQRRVLINPSESQQGIYEEAKRLVISRYLKKEGIVNERR